ncbi:Cystinosin-like [Gracilariopsis chorda]|uniref:Cystinosin-like n=1 Tax=Gracilariopsis chorda TaxID=448386 RepID=A0A2V3IQU6_9FLOR|nr:Cystinosin-like [Gracilariopsis chorda]|eukprot:PXF44491.1 Cystinosin-like [Gracilariopsis chorda]
MNILQFFHALFGWIYFSAWSASFWPQVLLNFRRKTTAGLSPDFIAINIVGFISYAIYTFASYFDPAVAESYKRATGLPPQVEFNDVLFAVHGAIMCGVLVWQVFTYPPRIPPKRYTALTVGIAQTAVLLGLLSCIMRRLDWYKYLRWAGAVKVMSSIVKHFPQVYLNYHRTSTVGWSFSMVLMDVVGGVFSIAQQAIRCIMMGSLAPFTSNMAKTALAAESLIFDFYFIAQHVCFYPDHTDLDVIRMKTESVDVEAGVPLSTEPPARKDENGSVLHEQSVDKLPLMSAMDT